ncbi:hypothetical protein [Rhodoferax mekongensis]|uniref:Uncharacterized protein n=1 Tax=Rhodoferax mekongensis TaxID=3068341 RepID=A0ABZ0B293_9BURK|nr:hypothetical protein [Rhodoferax sp. TBRC 17307]WNO05977.1 hypothetical protein RAN89_05995 [Rhodoferax sp. TBRC 17307]
MTAATEEKKLKGTVEFDITSVVDHVKTSEGALTDAKDYVIDSDNMLTLASGDLMNIKGLQKMVEAERVSKVKPLNDEVKRINDEYKVPANFLAQAETVLKGAISTYQTKQLEIAREAKRLADAKAAAEAAEIARKAEEARQAAAKLESDAKAAAESGDEAAAAAVAEQAAAMTEQAQSLQLAAEVVTSAPAVQAPARVSGISTRVTYSAQVDSLLDLVKAVAEGKAPLECIAADEKFLGAQARAFKKAGPLYPGVRAIAAQSIAARAA